MFTWMTRGVLSYASHSIEFVNDFLIILMIRVQIELSFGCKIVSFK